MADFFWGVDLSKEKPTAVWPFDSDEAEEDVEHTLNLRRVCLGQKAKESERNIVVASTVDSDGRSVASTIVRLKVGGLEQDNLHLDFYSSVTFQLVQGSGPVHLSGLYSKSKAGCPDCPGDYEEEDTADGDDFLSNLDTYKPMKRRASGAKGGDLPAKRPRVAVKAEESEDDSEDDDDSDDEMQVDMVKKPVTSVAAKTSTPGKTPAAKAAAVVSAGKAAAQKNTTPVMDSDDGDDNDEDDDDEDDDEDEEDDSEEGDDDDEDDGDEEDSEPSPPKKLAQPLIKNKQIAAIQQQVKAKQQQQRGEVRTPQPKVKPEQQQKATLGKHQHKATPSKPQGPADVDTIKKKLMTSPNLPKKPEKFANMMRATYKVTDQKKVTELWQWLQKNKK